MDSFTSTTENSTDQNEQQISELTLPEIFDNLYLRRILRENHNSEILNIELNIQDACSTFRQDANNIDQADEQTNSNSGGNPIEGSYTPKIDCSNILLSVSKNQAYIMSNYQAKESTVLTSGCWVATKDFDSIFVLGDTSGTVRVISVSQSREIAVYPMHSHPIAQIVRHPNIPYLALSISSDETIKLFDIIKGECLLEIHFNANTGGFSKDGKYFAAGSSTGELRIWDLSELDLNLDGTQNKDCQILKTEDSKLITASKKFHFEKIDCVRVLKNIIVAKNINGKLFIYNSKTLNLENSFHIPDDGNNTCKFDTSNDENYICVGNSNGIVYIYDLINLKLVKRLVHKRSIRPITCCVFTKNNRSIIYSTDSSFLWRYDYIDEKTVKAYTGDDKEPTKIEMQAANIKFFLNRLRFSPIVTKFSIANALHEGACLKKVGILKIGAIGFQQRFYNEDRALYDENGELLHKSISLINEEGKVVGKMETKAVLDGMDLKTHVLKLVDGTKELPVYKIYNRQYLFEREKLSKKLRMENRLKGVNTGIVKKKTIKMGTSIGKGDLEIKLRKIREILSSGHQVEIVISSRQNGEINHSTLMNEIIESCKDVSTVLSPPTIDRRNCMACLKGKSIL
ncbi:hypothetical protein BB560_005891 [Smittium megazygosporum]|uniref:Translation initiation factor 3 N-terminal domain-containing protein n=1 Tax=Smittium megazygosporum TaxID=133381 RepID=A0A2T9YRT9_9FUNG|nr:hypothetical protein BB560_005891 [Smittium megazygosporum]